MFKNFTHILTQITFFKHAIKSFPSGLKFDAYIRVFHADISVQKCRQKSIWR